MMTDEERRLARNEASKRCRLKKLAALSKTENKTNSSVKQSVTNTKIQKQIDKFVKKYAKHTTAMKSLIKDAASILFDIYKVNNEKFISKSEKNLLKELNLVINHTVENTDKPKFTVEFNMSKTFSIPKNVINNYIESASGIETDNDQEITVDPEIVTDPEIVAKLVDNPSTNEDMLSNEETVIDEEDDYEDEEDVEDEEDDYEDEEELTYEEREERRYREEEALDNDYFAGRWDAMSELDAQGWREED